MFPATNDSRFSFAVLGVLSESRSVLMLRDDDISNGLGLGNAGTAKPRFVLVDAGG